MGIPFLTDDQIACESTGDQAYQEGFRFNFRDLEGKITQDTVQVTDLGTRSSTRQILNLNFEGTIESASIDNAGSLGAPAQPGRCYVTAYLLRGGTAIAIILSGYFYSGHNPSYPGTIQGPGEGPGFIRTIATADPAAGAEVAVTAVPAGNVKWRPLAFSVSLVQGITQTPLPTLRIRTNGTTIAAQIPITSVAISASSTARLTWALGLVQTSFTAVVGDEFHIAPMPDLPMIAGDDIGTITDGIGANTDYGAAQLTVEEWVLGG